MILPNSARESAKDNPVDPTQNTISPTFIFASVGGQGDALGRTQKNAKTESDWAWKNTFSKSNVWMKCVLTDRK